MAMPSIVATAPLHGVKLAGPITLPSSRPAPVTEPAAELLDASGVLATEPALMARVAAWRDATAYISPPLLEPAQEATRAKLAGEAVQLVAALQAGARQHGSTGRGFQRKTLYAATNGQLRVPETLPAELEDGPFHAGARYRAIVRFSSADPRNLSDAARDQRAVGIRITDDAGHVHDLTFTSGAAGNHARGARQFNSTMAATVHFQKGTIRGILRGALTILLREGPFEMIRLARTRQRAVDRGVSLAALRYYSRSPVEMGRKLVHLALVPLSGTESQLVHEARGARDGLRRDLIARRAAGDIRFRIAAAEAPGLTDLSAEPSPPWVTVGELLLPREMSTEAEQLAVAATVDGLAIHPFNRWDDGALRPRGELNEILRGPVYAASARNAGRGEVGVAAPRP